VNGKTLHLVQRLPNLHDGVNQQQQSSTDRANLPYNAELEQTLHRLIGRLDENGQNTTINTNNGMEVHIDLGNISQQVNENEIRSRIRNIRRFLTMAQSRLNRLEEIQSGAPLGDTANGTIIVGSIQTTAIGEFGAVNGSVQTSVPQRFITSIPFMTTNLSNNSGQDSQPSILTQVHSQPNSSVTTNETTEQTQPSQTDTNIQSNRSNEEASSQRSRREVAPPQPENISVEVLADVTQSVMNMYTRFQPFLQQYHQMLINDSEEPPASPSVNRRFGNSTTSSSSNNSPAVPENRRQRFCNNINDMMHLLGHLFHNLRYIFVFL
jgi:hypothetical protein